MRPLGHNLLVREIKEDIKETSGGLLLGESHRDDIRYRKAEIVSLGDAIEVDGLTPDKIIWIDKHAGNKIDLPGEVLTVIKLNDIVIVE